MQSSPDAIAIAPKDACKCIASREFCGSGFSRDYRIPAARATQPFSLYRISVFRHREYSLCAGSPREPNGAPIVHRPAGASRRSTVEHQPCHRSLPPRRTACNLLIGYALIVLASCRQLVARSLAPARLTPSVPRFGALRRIRTPRFRHFRNAPCSRHRTLRHHAER